MSFIDYEDSQDLANALASYAGSLASGKSMRCSFAVNGIPAEGSFKVITTDLMGYGTAVNFLGEVYAPADQFDMNAPMLIDAPGLTDPYAFAAVLISMIILTAIELWFFKRGGWFD